MNLRDIARFGAVVLIALAGLVLLAEGAKSTRGYSLTTKPRTKPREIRGLRPQSLSTAIGFGKRKSSFLSTDLDRHNSMIFSPQKNMQQKFPLIWLLQYLRRNPQLANKVEPELLFEDDEDVDDDNDVRSSATYRYKKGSDSDDSYYLNN